MKRSTERILTTHVGSLIRPEALQDFMRAKQADKPYDHAAYEACLAQSVADVVRRYKRMRGYEVVLTTGTDEHGVNVERAAKNAGIPESEFVARMATAWRELWNELGLNPDEFVRTTDLKHVRTVQWLFKLCKENGYVYKGHYTGQYCIYDNAFVNDAKPGDNCPDCGRPTETVTEENYFFKLSAFQKPLLDFYKKYPNFITRITKEIPGCDFLCQKMKAVFFKRWPPCNL